jgi:hypothetical protein
LLEKVFFLFAYWKIILELMKKRILAFAILLLSPVLASCGSVSSTSTSSKQKESSTCTFEGAPFSVRLGETADLPTPTVTPSSYQDQWYPANSSDGSILVMTVVDGVKKALGLMPGEAAINYQCKIANKDLTVPTSQAVFNVLDPVSENSSVSSLLAASEEQTDKFYTINAILEGAEPNNSYGAAFLTDPTTREQIRLSHASEYDLFKYKQSDKTIFFNNKDIRCTASPSFVSGDLVTAFVQLKFTEGVPYLDGYFQKKETNDSEPTITIKDGDTISLSKTTGLKWGETIEATLTPETGKNVKGLIIDRGYAQDYAAGKSLNVFTFTLTSTNYLSIEYAEPGTTPVLQISFTWFSGDSFSPLTGDDLTSQVASHISTEQKDAFDKIGSVQGCYPGAKGLWFSSTGKTSASFDVSLNVRTAIRAKVKAYRHQPSSEDTLYIGGSPYVPTSSSVTTEFTINASTGSYINYLSFAFNSADKNMYIYSIMFFK